MADWSALPDPAVALIARRLQMIEDFVAFRRTCSSWRAATSLNDFDLSCPRPPLLMLDRPTEYYGTDRNRLEFFSLSRSKTCKISLPDAKNMVLCSGSKGWLIMVGYNDDMCLLHPITGVQISLPIHPKSLRFFFRKAVLSASPSETSDYVLMIVCQSPGGFGYMFFWKPGDLIWTLVESRPSFVFDMNCYNGKFYVLTRYHILMYDVLGPNPKKATKIIDLPWRRSRPHAQLVECAGRLLVVAPFYTYHIDTSLDDDLEIAELDVINGTYTSITSLGNSAVFLGYGGEAFSIDATLFPGILEPNCIYFNEGHYQHAVFGRNTDFSRLYDIKKSRTIFTSGLWFNF